MDFTVNVNKENYEVILGGYSDKNDSEKVIKITKDFLKNNSNTLIFNFKKITILDSVGLSVLLLAKNEVDKVKNKEIILSHPSPRIKSIFKNFNIEKIIKIQW